MYHNEIDFVAYMATDQHGNTASGVANESSDTIQLCGLLDADGEPFYFESELYHAGSECAKHGITFHAKTSLLNWGDL